MGRVIPLLPRRRVEAEMLLRVYRVLCPQVGPDRALAVVAAAVEGAAEAAGREFARQAPGGPSLEHFATVLDRWREGDALDVREVRLEEGVLAFTVTRCRYADLYRSMGLSVPLARTLSCGRDAAFARGYHAGLTLERRGTIVEGAAACRFRFVWEG
ncbi:L-2-amino-thiazoline-4-carboxylic acid hydrolase [Deferrisoma camini]|uniref:L-2-amino-thiazoline-4-carboxylic acid hydrolase n=1 Tax=Deferrisoma camini TaxID=1035120 RepID=UPI00046D1456|nr:L-2-amino-thiazoline-4-carboxylic acid hydrolase [Deferrisoma camini]